MKSHTEFIKAYFLISLSFFLIAFGSVLVFLYRSGELTSFSDVVTYQTANDAIYGTALDENSYLYKLKLAGRLKPKIIALGSSRVMQFRRESFTKPFVNCGGGMHTPKDVYSFLDELFKVAKPEIILLGVDFWWFNAESEVPPSDRGKDGSEFTYKKLRLPFQYISEKK